MIKSCEKKVTYGVVNEAGQRVPILFRYEQRSLLDTSRLPACIARPVELALAIGVVAAGGINRLVSEKPLQVSLAIATGTLAFGVAATAMTYYLLSR